MKNVIITGSTSGIGLGIARFFAKAGNNILLNGLEKNGAEIAKSIADEFEVQTIYSPANILEPSQIYDMVTEAETTFGKVDVLINNAGIQFVSLIGSAHYGILSYRISKKTFLYFCKSFDPSRGSQY